jgi:hypothetical protein
MCAKVLPRSGARARVRSKVKNLSSWRFALLNQ